MGGVAGTGGALDSGDVVSTGGVAGTGGSLDSGGLPGTGGAPDNGDVAGTDGMPDTGDIPTIGPVDSDDEVTSSGLDGSDVAWSDGADSGDAASTDGGDGPGTSYDTGTPPTLVNLALNKPVTASSQQHDKEAIFGNDGSSTTSFCPSNSNFPIWWRVDLGASFNVVGADINFEMPNIVYRYKIDTSLDDVAWATAVDQSTNTTRKGTTLSDAFVAQARYVRITVLGAGSGYWGCFWELSLWGYAASGTPAANLTNLALGGTAYRWTSNTSSTANGNRSAEPKLNDNSTLAAIDLNGSGEDQVGNAWEAAGVILARAATVTSVVFVNGGVDDIADGNFAANFHLQTSLDGTTWTDATGWTISPPYPHDSTASNQSYVLSGTATGVLGVRVVGQVHIDYFNSWNVSARELMVWGTSP
jgi:hypothetical protein